MLHQQDVFDPTTGRRRLDPLNRTGRLYSQERLKALGVSRGRCRPGGFEIGQRVALRGGKKLASGRFAPGSRTATLVPRCVYPGRGRRSFAAVGGAEGTVGQMAFPNTFLNAWNKMPDTFWGYRNVGVGGPDEDTVGQVDMKQATVGNVMGTGTFWIGAAVAAVAGAFVGPMVMKWFGWK